MRRLVACAAAVAVTGSAFAASAVGQGTGGTVGEGARGTFEFALFFREAQAQRRTGVNPAVPRGKNRPKIADMLAGNADLLVGGRRAGINYHYEINTHAGPRTRRYRGGAVQTHTDIYDFGNGNLLFMACKAEDAPTDNHCAVIGGTGRYTGARGSAVQSFERAKEDRRARTFTLPVTVTFVP